MAKTLDIHQALVEKSRQGDRKSQAALYKAYAKAMYNLCTRMLNDDALAQDVLQESFIDAFQKINSFRGDATFGAWLKRIVINNCISALKKRQRLRETNLDESSESVLADGMESETETGDLPAPEIIQQAIKELPTGCRTVFTLYCMEGYSHKEIASIMQVSVGTSKSQYNRARMLLREALQYQKV